MNSPIPAFEEDDYFEEEEVVYKRLTKRTIKPSISESTDKKPLISYEYISLNKSSFCFDYDNLDNKDYTHYFKILKNFSQRLIASIINAQDKDLKFHEVKYYNKPVIKECINENIPLGSNQYDWPIVYQFALYKAPKIPDKKTKCPRVYFIMQGGIFYILLMDAYHEISPTDY